MKRTIILLIGICFFQYACCINEAPSTASITVLENMESVLFQNCPKNCLQKFEKIGINQDDGQLYINAFNVGQGNFIVLRKDNHAVIIDAGGRLICESEKVDELLINVVIDAVFITHPHDDHFSLFNSKLFEAFPKSFANTVFYLSGEKNDWESKKAKNFLQRLGFLSNVISSVQYLNNKQLEISLLNGVVFKTFYLEPPIKREPNNLSLLLQVSYMGKNILFTGDAEGDSIARLFQTIGDLSSAASLMHNKDEVESVVKMFHHYTAAHRDFLELRSLCRSLVETFCNNYIFDDPNVVVNSVQNLIDSLVSMQKFDESFFRAKNKESLQSFIDTITPLANLRIDPFFYFCFCHLCKGPACIFSLQDMLNVLNNIEGTDELCLQLSSLGELLQVPLFSIWKRYESLKEQYIQGFLSLLDEKNTFNDLNKAVEAIFQICQDLQLPLLNFVKERLEVFRSEYGDLLSEDLVNLSSENFKMFSSSYFTQFQNVSETLGGGINSVDELFYQYLLDEHFSDVIEYESESESVSMTISDLFKKFAESIFDLLLNDDVNFIPILFEESLPFLTSVFTVEHQAKIAELANLKKYSVQSLRSVLMADFETDDKELCKSIFQANFVRERIIAKLIEDIKFLPYVRIAFLKMYLSEYINAKLTEHYYDLMKRMVFLNAKRSTFKNSQIVFLPHHGTNTKNSQNILGLFAGRDFRKPEEQRIFIVSSSPFGSDKLPKASTLEMAPFFPVHPVHKFIYCRDYSSFVNMIDTEKPIYLTGAAPAGVITVKIDSDGASYILDLVPREDGKLGWIDTLTGERIAFFDFIPM